MSEKIRAEEIEYLSQLSRLGLKKEEVGKYQKEISQVLEYVDLLKEVDIKDVEPTAQVTGTINVVREDKIVPSSLSRDELLENTPDKKDGFIKVKSILK